MPILLTYGSVPVMSEYTQKISPLLSPVKARSPVVVDQLVYILTEFSAHLACVEVLCAFPGLQDFLTKSSSGAETQYDLTALKIKIGHTAKSIQALSGS